MLTGTNGEVETRVTTLPAEALGGRMRVTAENYKVQEGAKRFAITGGNASVQLGNLDGVDVAREANGDVLLLVTLRSWHAPAKARIGATGAGSRGFAEIALPVSDDYIRYGIPLKCLRDKGADVAKLTRPFVLETEGKADFAIAEVRLGSDAQQELPCR
jgi:beta-glucosidase